ncbi:MAG: glycosyltransferase family 39 protein, partial [Acidobacteria bacterium]|nr:glycosyltransferase family 39 protein [Acidobacteriota bacterium]
MRLLLGDSLLAIRLVPALAGAANVFLTGCIARELGGRRFAQSLGMLSLLIASVFLSLNHFYSMNALDLLFWTLSAYVLIRLLKGSSDREWLALGVILGLGLQNKLSVLWLGFGLAVGLVLTPARRRLLTRWPWLAAAFASLIFLPHLLWQIANAWPTLEFVHNATTQKMAEVSWGDFLKGLIDAVHPLTLPLWVSGLAF